MRGNSHARFLGWHGWQQVMAYADKLAILAQCYVANLVKCTTVLLRATEIPHSAQQTRCTGVLPEVS